MARSTARDIAAAVEQRIRQGDLGPGAWLPSVREYARDVGASPSTVAAAYRELRARGIVVSKEREGMRVAATPPLAYPAVASLPPGVIDLASGNPDPALLPHQDLVPERGSLRLYGDDAIHPPLAEMARSFLSAGEQVRTDHMLVVNGALDGIERILQAHVRHGDHVGIENPGYSAVIDMVQAMGLKPEPLALDDDGVLPESLAKACAAGAKAVIITPRAQNPFGAAMSEARRNDLVSVLDAHPEVVVIEDDHAGPISGKDLVSLTQARSRWAFVQSVSKWLGPDLRVALVFGDELTVARVRGRQQLGPGWVSNASQRMAYELWSHPTTNSLLADATRIYAERRQALIESLHAEGFRVSGRSGLNVWVEVPDEGHVTRELLVRGYAVRQGDRFHTHPGTPAIRVTISRLPPSDAPELVDALRRILLPGTSTIFA